MQIHSSWPPSVLTVYSVTDVDLGICYAQFGNDAGVDCCLMLLQNFTDGKISPDQAPFFPFSLCPPHSSISPLLPSPVLLLPQFCRGSLSQAHHSSPNRLSGFPHSLWPRWGARTPFTQQTSTLFVKDELDKELPGRPRFVICREWRATSYVGVSLFVIRTLRSL